MNTLAHPMDNIIVRPLKFSLAEKNQQWDTIWSKTNPEFAIYMNALGMHVPYFETFLVKVMRTYRDEVKDNEKLFTEVRRIIGQEAHHAKNFNDWNDILNARYPDIKNIDEKSKQYFIDKEKTASKKFKIGFVAGYETFTFLAGLIILDRYKEYMEDADPVIRAMWVWHQVEEVEHGAVAFDFFKAFYPKSEWYRKAMVVLALLHIIIETRKVFHKMIKREGYYKSFRKTLKAWGFFAKFSLGLLTSALPVFKKKYHPSTHPACTNNQNKIAVAWREHYDSGQDSHYLDNTIMNILQK